MNIYIKELWNPWLNEKLETIHEKNNPQDRYAVAQIRKLLVCLASSSWTPTTGDAKVYKIYHSRRCYCQS